jgi:uncharacterized membrane protein
MTLSFLTPLMLAGAALIAAPIILHLVMRQQPKHLIFPALRFVQRRQDANKRRLKLRHLLLLLLRCAAILFFALALARPTLQSAGFLGDQEAPVAAALVFDTSPRMQYRQLNQTRLEAAQETALRVLAQLPKESDVAVLDSRTLAGAFSIDASAARQRIGRLAISAAAQPLPELCQEAVRLVSGNQKLRKEIYVFTDLATIAWPAEASGRLREKLTEKTDVAVYVIDVGVVDPQNFSLGDLRLSADSVAKNTPLNLETELIRIGPEEERTVTASVIEADGQPHVRAQASEKAQSDASQAVRFQLDGLDEGTHQGVVRIAGEDSLPADDVRYFTVEVRPPWKILVAAPKPVQRHAVFLTEALAPATFRKTGQARFECETVSFDDLQSKSLDDYAAVCLLDPPALSDQLWQSLAAYVDRGGGVAIWLGRNAQPKAHTVADFNTEAAAKIMPGKLAQQWHRQDAFLAPQDYQHPLLAKFRQLASGIPWDAFTVFSHWQLSDLADGVSTIVRYSNGQPALVERTVGKGRVLVLTTPISDEANDPDLWNLLAVGSEPWPFVMLSNEMLLYLVGSGEERLNCMAGETVTLRLPEDERQLIFSLHTPDGEDYPQSIDQRTGNLTITTTGTPGNYQLRSGGTRGGVRRGFSINVPAAVTNLARLERDEFETLLGKDRFRLSRSKDEIDRNVNLGRAGQELYPLLIILVALVLGLEHLLANKFYRRDPHQDEEKRLDVAALVAETAVAPPPPPREPVEAA